MLKKPFFSLFRIMPTKPKIIVILGPTASGKSDLAVKIAKKNNGEVISADSRQVYYGLNVGSGKITKKEMAGVPHHLLDVANPKRVFTVVQYQKLAGKAIRDIIKRKKIPIICGGTGFYIDSLIHNYKLPEVPPDKKLRAKLEKKFTEELFKQLKKLDPRRAKNIDRYNKRRLIRALEIVISTKKPVPVPEDIGINQFNRHKSAAILKIGTKKQPEELKKLIYKRLIRRLKAGMIKEVENLHKKGVSWQRLDDLGLEYRYISRYLRGLITKPKMIEILNKEICRYAKRQMTWFKRDENIYWLDPAKNQNEAIGLVKKFVND